MKQEKLYWPPGVTVDAVIFTIEDGVLKVLLIKRTNEPFLGSWALPGGFLLKNETLERASRRILKEKAGVANIYFEQLYTFDNPARDPRGHVISATYMALVPRGDVKFGAGELQSPSFFSVNKPPALAFDHRTIVNYAVKRLRAKLEYTNVAYSLLPKEFSLLDLQNAYEAILDKKLDKRNFRKKFDFLGLIRPTTKMQRGSRQRPARLYRFKSRTVEELKKFF